MPVFTYMYVKMNSYLIISYTYLSGRLSFISTAIHELDCSNWGYDFVIDSVSCPDTACREHDLSAEGNVTTAKRDSLPVNCCNRNTRQCWSCYHITAWEVVCVLHKGVRCHTTTCFLCSDMLLFYIKMN